MKPGEIYWVSSSEVSHPHVVIEVTTSGEILMCVISTNLKRANLPGNVLLEKGEANLPKASIVLVSRTILIQSEQAGTYIGSLTSERLAQVLAGIDMIANLSRQSH